LIPLNHQQNAEGILFINEENPSTYPDGSYLADIPWDWNQFYKYLSMSGLHQTDAFNWEMSPDSIEYQNYYKYAIIYGKNSFKKDCID